MAKSNIGFLEHVNLTLPPGAENLQLAKDFYFGVLGCAQDPRPESMLKAMGRPADGLLWANAGLQQVHLPVEEYAQILRGTIGIEARDLESVARNAEKAMKAGTFRKTEFAMRRTTFQAPLEFESKEALEINCPWGNRFLVTQATGNGSRDPVKQFWINGHDVAKSHGHPKPVAQNELLATGIRFLEFNVPLGTLPAVTKHYRDILGAKVSHVNLNADEESGERKKAVVVWVGDQNEQWISFKEVEEKKLTVWDGHHVALYINSFVHSHDTADNADLIYKNHRFQMLDRAEDWEKVQQYRLLEVRDDDGKRVTELELEVRSFQNRFCPVVRRKEVEVQARSSL